MVDKRENAANFAVMSLKKQIPEIHPVRQIDLPEVQTWKLDNGLPVYSIGMGTQDVVRVEAIFWAGRPYEQAPLVARTTNALLKEGTRAHTSGQLAERLDYYGAGISLPFQLDTGNVVLYALHRHLPSVLPHLLEVLTQPTFPEDELRAYCRRKQQGLLEDLSKNDVVAYRQITECFFGQTHPYGYNSLPKTYLQLERDTLVAHHQKHFHAGNGFLLISGKIDAAVEKLINDSLSQLPAGPAIPLPPWPVDVGGPEKIRLQQGEAAQTAIRIGRRLFPRSHKDAHGMHVLATLLGGYFGSRLMENIREDKGYTYNITASYDPLRLDGALHIDTEVSHDVVADSLHQIYFELDRLCQEPVSAQELSMVKNYLMGTYLTMVDGPFNWAETVRTFLTEELPIPTLLQLVETTRQISPSDLQDLAQQYFQKKDQWEIVVGPSI